jgi:membrane protease YdiL (CAAX protease family)
MTPNTTLGAIGAIAGILLFLGPSTTTAHAGTGPFSQEPARTIAHADPLAPHGSENAGDPASAARPGAAFATVLLAIAALPAFAVIARRRLDRSLAPDTPPEPPFARVADWPVLLFAGLLIWVAQAVGAASAFTLFSLDNSARASLRGVALASLGGYLAAAVAAALLFAFLPGLSTIIRADHPLRAALASLPRAVAAFILVFPIVMTLGWLTAAAARWISGEPPRAVAHETLRLLTEPAAPAESRAWWFIVTLSVLLAAPIVEELIYRGFIQSAIRRAILFQLTQSRPGDAPPPQPERLNVPSQGRRESSSDAPAPRADIPSEHPERVQPSPHPIIDVNSAMPRLRAARLAVLITSALFTLMHAGVAETHALITLFALSLCFGVAYERTGRIATSILMHALFNATNLALALV